MVKINTHIGNFSRIKILFLFFCLYTLGLNAQDIQHFEPSNWWIEMKNPELQIMVHGPGIADYTVKTADKGIKIKGVYKVENPNYLFVDIVIKSNAKPGKVEFVFANKAQNTLTATLTLDEREKDSARRPGFGNVDVIYLITPDRFSNGDPSNDAVETLKEGGDRNSHQGRHGGDLAGINQNLEYLRDLGISTIWCMPLVENNMEKVSYHGYSATDLYQIDARLGSNEQFRNIVKRSKELGIKWIMDVVPNHIGLEHWWMKDLPARDWIHNGGTFTPTNHRREAQQDPHASEWDKKKMTEGWFVPTMPDLNQSNPFLAKYLIQNTIWWIEYAGLSGLRVDTYPYAEKHFMANWVQAILNEYPRLNLVGEEWSLKPSVISYWQKGKQNADGYISYMPSMMDFPLQNAIRGALTENESYNTGWARLYETLAEDHVYASASDLVIFLDNHDMSRFFTQVHHNPDLLKMGLVLLSTLRGTPQIFYGTEIGMANPNTEEHGIIRSDMPGGWTGDTVSVITGKGLNDTQLEILHLTQKLLNWRKNTPAVIEGDLIQFVPEDGIYSYFRKSNDQLIWVILNKNTSKAEIDLTRYRELIPEGSELRDVFEKNVLSKKPEIPPMGFKIFEINKFKK